MTVSEKSLKALSTSSLCAIASRQCIWLYNFCISFGLVFFSLIVTQRDFTKVFVSGLTDVTQSSREMTYFGSGLNLASQETVTVMILLCNSIPFLYSALNSANVKKQSFPASPRGAA